MGLAARLHDETKALHTEAERSGVMAALLRGQASREAYLRLLVSLHAIYSALESALDAQASDPILAPLYAPAFARRAALARDLEEAIGPDWRQWVPAIEAFSYAAHLAKLAREQPVLLLAHAWLRYLGDLNGGQIIARLLRGMPALAGLPMHFYEFPALADPRAAAARWREALDALPLEVAVQDLLVAEASEGFRRHIVLFRALADQGPAAPSLSA